ncbi:MAG: hypothetical protein WA085_06630 [Sphingobium sp.]|uniref:hypothetical protein n=1 Tax=Sphingobium sp. CECT 9361 TaxID=2845384 RepID=UPI001E46B0F4|nr:hypothetical protein [Sphingobium sp. CECT 9361]CAH0355515.1 hypothetical protein SPH9361_03594 [Sphingobium sp. CECT 9361]
MPNYRKTSKPISRRISNWYSLLWPTGLQRPMACALVTSSDECNRFSTALAPRIAAFEDGATASCDASRFTVSIKPANVPLLYRIFGMVGTNVAMGFRVSVSRHVSQSRQPSRRAMTSSITRSVPRCIGFDDDEGHPSRFRRTCGMAGA